jgi:light-regulated signal transduction histidine kinase (bacteriophytochrome)
VDCSQIIDIVLNNLRLAIQDNQATIQAKNLPIVLADSMQLAQLFQNLIGNALKFRGKSNPIITITANHEEHHWRFQVIDNGIGIDPQYSERIFNIFQRLHNREEYEGTGIGLAICRKIIERHGGSIGVQSQLGQGSSFWFTIPDQPETIPITELSFSPS